MFKSLSSFIALATVGVLSLSPSTKAAPNIKVSGNKFVDSNGSEVKLHGVNRSGGEFSCIQGNGFFDGPTDQASIDAIKSWKVNAVRVPTNEDCWLGLSNVPSQYSGSNYQNAIKDYVNRLLSNDLTVILEVHWTNGDYSCGAGANCQKPMPGPNTPQYWTSVANAFKDTRIIFDLFNEPFPDRVVTGGTTAAWNCWKNGGSGGDCSGINYSVTGFQTIVDSIRSTGNSNALIVGGLAYSNDLSQILTYMPYDSQNNIGVFAHVYNFNACNSQSCWDQNYAPVASKYPLVISEIGENDCAHGFIDSLMSWADSKGVSYLGWTWNTWDCSTGPSLISNYDGTPTNFGVGYRDHLASL
ncbi:endo-1,4-beta-glucanase [Violaceomyces palustris]|uniref:Endo-1,4-beta-glucanase n=1 Tax=Violaceomyces palustris TaxID=1673888 RepID=A0ACD0NUA8_9BASI|nr:endo-1,4-beta-glucanase [Violaceomyces palustris]